MKGFVVLLIASQLVACASLNTVYTAPGPLEPYAVLKGDHVVLATAQGERRLEVTAVTHGEICGRQECVRLADVRSIQREEQPLQLLAPSFFGMLILAALAVL